MNIFSTRRVLRLFPHADSSRRCGPFYSRTATQMAGICTDNNNHEGDHAGKSRGSHGG